MQKRQTMAAIAEPALLPYMRSSAHWGQSSTDSMHPQLARRREIRHRLGAAQQDPAGSDREREETYVLRGKIQMDDAYLGGERPGGRAGRGSENKIPIVAAVSLNEAGQRQSLTGPNAI